MNRAKQTRVKLRRIGDPSVKVHVRSEAGGTLPTIALQPATKRVGRNTTKERICIPSVSIVATVWRAPTPPTLRSGKPPTKIFASEHHHQSSVLPLFTGRHDRPE